MQTYFLGGVSSAGFESRFIKQIEKSGFYTYILKGGPGSGKSTLMKKLAEAFKDEDIELYHCSSDIKSVDAVVLKNHRCIVVDGTAPHVFEPEYPAICQEIINLGEYWDKAKIQAEADGIKRCFDENRKCHKRAKRFVQAFASLNSDIFSIAEAALNIPKLDAYIERLGKKLFGKPEDKKGSIEFKQLSALTAEGYITRKIPENYTAYLVKDDYFAGGDYFLRALASSAEAYGAEVIVSECTMLRNGTFEHMLIPSHKLAFMSCNFFNGYFCETERIINFMRFYEKDTLALKKQRINFNKRVSAELCSEAAASIFNALDIHDELEKYFIGAMDFEGLDKRAKRLIEEIKGR